MGQPETAPFEQPQRALFKKDIDFSKFETERVAKSANGVSRGLAIIDGKETEVYFKPADPNFAYNRPLAKYSVGTSYLLSRVLGRKIVPEELLVLDDQGNIVGSCSRAVEYNRLLYWHEKLENLTPEQRELKFPSKETLIAKNIARQLIALWVYGDTDRHAGNFSLDVLLDNDKNLQDLIGDLKATPAFVDWLKWLGILDYNPARDVPLKPEQLKIFPNIKKRIHWPSYPVPENYNFKKAHKSYKAFQELEHDPRFHQQMYEALLEHIVLFDPEKIREGLELYFGKMPLDFNEANTSCRPDTAKKVEQNKPELFNRFTNDGSFVEHMLEIAQYKYDELYRLMIRYTGCNYNDDNDPNDRRKLPQFNVFLKLKPQAINRIIAWAEEENKKYPPGSPQRYNIDKIKQRYYQIWRDSHYHFVYDALKDFNGFLCQFANSLSLPHHHKVFSFQLPPLDATETSEFFDALRETPTRILDCDTNHPLRNAYNEMVEIKNEFAALVDEYFGREPQFLLASCPANMQRDTIYVEIKNQRVVYSLINLNGKRIMHQPLYWPIDSQNSVVLPEDKLKTEHLYRLKRQILAAASKEGFIKSKQVLTAQHNSKFIAGIEEIIKKKEGINKLLIKDSANYNQFNALIKNLESIEQNINYNKNQLNTDKSVTTTEQLPHQFDHKEDSAWTSENMKNSLNAKPMIKHTDPRVISRCLHRIFKWANEKEEIPIDLLSKEEKERLSDSQKSKADWPKTLFRVQLLQIIEEFYESNGIASLFTKRLRGNEVKARLKLGAPESAADILLWIWSDPTGGEESTSLNTRLLEVLIPQMLSECEDTREEEYYFENLREAIKEKSFVPVSYTQTIVEICRDLNQKKQKAAHAAAQEEVQKAAKAKLGVDSIFKIMLDWCDTSEALAKLSEIVNSAAYASSSCSFIRFTKAIKTEGAERAIKHLTRGNYSLREKLAFIVTVNQHEKDPFIAKFVWGLICEIQLHINTKVNKTAEEAKFLQLRIENLKPREDFNFLSLLQGEAAPHVPRLNGMEIEGRMQEPVSIVAGFS